MSLEDSLFEQRLRRVQEMESLGFLAYGQRYLTVVSGRKVLVEVVYVRPRRSFGDARIVLRRLDTGRVLPDARTIADLLPPPGSW